MSPKIFRISSETLNALEMRICLQWQKIGVIEGMGGTYIKTLGSTKLENNSLL